MTVLPPRPAHPLTALLVAGLVVAGAAGCGRAKQDEAAGPAKGVKTSVRGDQKDAAEDLGFPIVATKNTTRIAAADPVATAAAVSQIVHPGSSLVTQPPAVALVDAADWQGALAATSLYAQPVGALTLFAKGRTIPAATTKALTTLRPAGSRAVRGAKVIRIGTLARPGALPTTDVQAPAGTPAADQPFALARRIDAFASAARGRPSTRIMLVSADQPAYAAPAAAWAAATGDAILFTRKTSIPKDTVAAIRTRKKPVVYVLGPSSVIAPKVTRRLRALGEYHRVGGPDPIGNAIGFARYAEGDFGWGATQPGHGLVMLPQSAAPATFAAAAPLSASGTYGPSLLLSGPTALGGPLDGYLKDIQPGFDQNAARGFYNHAWLVGDVKAITPGLQAIVDGALESQPITDRSSK